MSIQENRQRMLDILKDTIDYYREDPEQLRAVNSYGECVYTTDEGHHCAIGRYFRPEFKTTEFGQNEDTNINMLDNDLDFYLSSRVIGLEFNFWSKLQSIHDGCMNWDVDGLSDAGKEKYVMMQDSIIAGRYDND